MIIAKNISKKFKELILFENASCKIEDKSKTLIKGVNGSGKSVFLKILVGYSTPDTGCIIIDDYELQKDKDFISNAGVSINAPEFMKNETGLQNLIKLAEIRKIASKEDIINLATKLGMEQAIYKKYKTYSLGMKQKMRIIQALMDKPKYLILDEPFDALDKKSCMVVEQVLDEHVKAGGTLIFTTHSTVYEDFADSILEIEDYSIKKLK